MNQPQRDYLTELLNIGIGRSASALSELVGLKVNLKVPEIDVRDFDSLRDYLSTFDCDQIAAVKQRFEGSFSGDAYLVFSRESGRLLVRRLLGESIKDSDLEFETSQVLSEVGNIVINGFLGSWSHIFPNRFSYGVPEFTMGSPDSLVEHGQDATGAEQPPALVFARALFEIEDIQVAGTILALFDMASLENLVGAIDRTAERAQK